MKIGRMKMILSDWLYAAVVHGNHWGKDSYSVFMVLACMICKKTEGRTSQIILSAGLWILSMISTKTKREIVQCFIYTNSLDIVCV